MERLKCMIEIAKKEGTPAYIFDVKQLTERVSKIKKTLGKDIELCFSIKANPFLICELEKVVDKLEVCSPGELDICRHLGTHCSNLLMNKIVYSGVSKTYENIQKAFLCGVGKYTVESIEQAERINSIACDNQKILPVLLRLNSGSQFGMSKKDLEYIIQKRDTQFANIKIQGLHYFVGTQRKSKDFAKQKNDLHELQVYYEELYKKYGLRLEELEYGPGLPVNLYESEMENDTFLPLTELADELHSVSKWAKLTVEMGRFIAAECGYYVTQLMEKKSVDDINYAVFDGGINHVNYYGQIMGMNIPVIHHFDCDGKVISGKAEEWRVCGSLCTVNDYLVKSYHTEKMQLGDYLIFCNIGAYSITESMYLFLSRTMPKVILLLESGNYKVVRDFVETSIFNTCDYTV